jgi:chemotaxis protein MotB
VHEVEPGDTEVIRKPVGPNGEETGGEGRQAGRPLTGMAALRVGDAPDAKGLSGHANFPGDQVVDGMRAPTEAELKAELERQEKEAFEAAAEQIREAVRGDPSLAELANQLAIDMTPEGLRIQIMDEVRQPMFATGSSVPNERARLLLQKVAPVLQKLPQAISIAGHTDAAPFAGRERTNWELSAERANATRRLLVEGGLPVERIRTVTGHAERDPLLPADPFAAANRRIAIVVLKEAGAKPAQP